MPQVDDVVVEAQVSPAAQLKYDSFYSPLPLPHTPLPSQIHVPPGPVWIANVPPPSYVAQFYPGVISPSSDEDYLSLMCSAATRPLARCPRTGIAIQSPLSARDWADCFIASRYPDRQAALTLVTALRSGVRLGYTGKRTGTHEGRNLPTANENATAIEANLDKELQNGRRRGPCSPSSFPFFFANPLGVVFKRMSSKPRVIHHLSYPRTGDSVNAHVVDLEVRLKAFERAVENLRACGRGTFMAKIDVEAAYRCIPVAPDDWPLQGMKWKGAYFFDIVMQFGLASATAIFEYYSSSAEYFARMLLLIQYLEHYVDDFFLMAKTRDECLRQRDKFLALLRKLGLPYSLEKLEGPDTHLLFLGILFDSIAMTLSLSADRLADLRSTLSSWMGRTTGSRKELQSLCGLLNFASFVVRSGRTFFRRILDELKCIHSAANADQQFPLSPQFFLDVKWWLTFASAWNGVSLLPPPPGSEPTVTVETDACKTGYGAVCGSEWLAGKWTSEELKLAMRVKDISMPWLELRAIVIAAATWGKSWAGQRVLIRSDCEPAIEAWRSETSADKGMADLIRSLLYLTATLDFHLSIEHVAGVNNPLADMLSRGQVTRFVESTTRHSHSPTTPLPPPIQTW